MDPVCHSVSKGVSYSTVGSNSTRRTITIMRRPGNEDDPYGGWKQQDLLVVDEVLVNGEKVPGYKTDFLGHDDDKYYQVTLDGMVANITEYEG